MNQLSTARPALFAGLLLSFSCAATTEDLSERGVNNLIQHGEFRAALEEAKRNHDENPDDEEARALLERAQIAALLDRGRSLSFQDKDDEALEVFRDVLERAPESSQAQQWVEKTENKLGNKWINIGLEYHAADNLPAAIQAYERALSYMPKNESATAGLATARFLTDYREGVGSGYYTAGVRALSEYYLQQAKTAFEKGLKYKEADRLSEERRNTVKVMLAEQRVVLGAEFESKGLYGAAKHEYRMALDLDENNTDAQTGVERADRESQAKQKLEHAQMQILRSNYAKARELLAEGRALTKAQIELFEGAEAGIDSAIHEDMYVAALDLYRDGDYEGAVKSLDKLLDIAEYYKDARTRRDNLKADIVAAADRYEQASNAESDEEKLRFLREIEVFWPNYKDIQLQIQRLDPEE